MKRAFMYLSQPNVGGAQLSSLGLADGLRGTDWGLDFGVSYDGPFVAECRSRGHQLSETPMPEWYRFRAGLGPLGRLHWAGASVKLAARLFNQLRQNRPDLLYFYGPRDLILCAPAAVALRIPVVFHLRIGGEKADGSLRAAFAVARLIGAALVCNSNHMLEFARAGGWQGPAEVIHNGISFDPSYDLPRDQARERLGLERDAVVIGCATRISPGKNLDLLLRVTAELKAKTGRPVVLLVAGGEDPFAGARLADELRALAAELKIADSVRWLGHLREMGPFYRALDLYLSLSKYESFGRTVAEAMGAGVPAMAIRTGGIAEIITDGVDGIFVPGDNAAEITRRALAVLSDPDRAAALGDAGRQSARARFSLETHTERMREFFDHAVDDRPSGRKAWTYVSHPNLGGAQLATLGLADGLRATDWRLEFAHSNDGPFMAECAGGGHQVTRVGMPEWYRFRPLGLLPRLRFTLATAWLSARILLAIRRGRPDILYLFERRDVLLCAPAALLLRLPMIYHVHGFFHPSPDALSRLPFKVGAALGAGIVCNSQATRDIAHRNGLAPGARVVYNGIDFRRLDCDRVEARARMAIPDGAWVIGCAARLSPEKGFEALLRAAARLKKELPRPFVLLLAGMEDPVYAGSYERRLRALAEELGVADVVRWLGFVRDMPTFYRSLDVFVSLTRLESFGRVYVEAMAAGVPVVGTPVGGVPEIIRDGETGILVPVDDDAAAAAAVAGLLAEPERAAALGQAGRDFVLPRFSLETLVRQMVDIFENARQRRR